MVDLKEVGVYRYAEDPTTGIWCFAWAFDEEEPDLWHPALPFPERLADHIAERNECRAWNAQFERIMWREVGVPKYGFPMPFDAQWVCTAAEAAAMALPRSLDACAAVVGSKHQKDNAGYQNMLRVCRPRSIKDGVITWWDGERITNLYEYCKQDVRTERSLLHSLRRLTPNEREMYLLDQEINDRGLMIDRPLVLAAAVIADRGAQIAADTLTELTNGDVTKATQHARFKAWLAKEGVVTDSVGLPAVTALLETDLPEVVRRALDARGEAGKASVAKLDSMQAVAQSDDVMRGLLLYHAAGTGRWGGMKVQPHNFPRGSVPEIERYIPHVLAGNYTTLDVFYPPVQIISSMLRSMIVARPGHDFVAADFSAIEARVLNWLAGQEDVVQSFREYDAGDKTKDPYKIMAVRMGRATSVDLVTYQDRQAGKAAELGCGFQMGWRKFIGAAWQVYQVRVDDEQAKSAVKIYRATHPFVEQLWYDANEAAIRAVREPGTNQRFGARKNLRFTCRGSYLYLILPSGRPLCYAAPKIVDRPTPWGDVRPAVEVWGTDSYTRQWCQYQLYGGIIVENAVQAVARDLMAEGMLRWRAAGFATVLTVHDEIVSEVRSDFGSVSQAESIMEELPEWATGCPVKAEGWRDKRYRK